MPKFIDLTGKRFGKLTVISRNIYNNKFKHVRWDCICECNPDIILSYSIAGDAMKSGNTSSCGCIRKEIALKNIVSYREDSEESINEMISNYNRNRYDKLREKEIGKLYNNCKIINAWSDFAKKQKVKFETYVKVKCHCGKLFVTSLFYLKSNQTKSCGCLNKFEEGEAARRALMYVSKRRAFLASLDWSIENCFYDLITKNCFYCGTKPTQIRKSKNGIYIYNGIDRIDNIKGYLPENVVTCCWNCNKIKGTLNLHDWNLKINRICKINYKKLNFTNNIIKKELEVKNCIYCNEEPKNFNNRNKKYRQGIDRVNNNKGYEIGNMVPCCKECNSSKGNSNKDDFIKYLIRLSKYNKGKTI